MRIKDLYKFELDLEKKWRKTKWLIPSIGIVVSLVLVFLIWLCNYFFNEGYWWTFAIAAVLGHSLFIVALHDGAHNSITKTWVDRWIMNVAAGILLLPFFGEAFRQSHLIHHGHSNSEDDPLWHSNKKYLYESMRWFYILCEMIPLLFHGYLLLRSSNERKKSKEKEVIGPGINYWFILMATAISTAIILLVIPSIWFVLGMIFGMNILGTIRHWCEHLGTDPKGSNNTFWFPLGMGIGNHDTHHYAAYVSWPVLYVGLLKRKRNSNPFRAIYGVLFNKNFIHYTEEGNRIGKS